LLPRATASDADGVLFDLLMAVMNSVDLWAAAAGDRKRGLQWRDGVTERMRAASAYVPYEALVSVTARRLHLAPNAPAELFERWTRMDPWPDASAIDGLPLAYGFVTNCSTRLAEIASGRSGLKPRFVLSAEEAGCYKPNPEIYRKACRKLGSAVERTVFVAGSPYDAEGARNAGLRPWLVARRADLALSDPAIPLAHSMVEVVGELAACGS
jgi:2-haloacid dehalogenase